MRKSLKYIIGIISIILIIYLSIDIKKLDNLQEIGTVSEFDLTSYVDNFWNNDLPASIESSKEITFLLKLLKEDPARAFSDYSFKLGISQTHYFMTKGEGIIKSIGDEDIVVTLADDLELKIAVGFIFGNAVRDGSGKVNIDDFLNMTDFNNVSIAIIKLVRNNIVSTLKRYAAPGMEIEFAGAMEINKENIVIADIRLIPVSADLNIKKSE